MHDHEVDPPVPPHLGRTMFRGIFVFGVHDITLLQLMIKLAFCCSPLPADQTSGPLGTNQPERLRPSSLIEAEYAYRNLLPL